MFARMTPLVIIVQSYKEEELGMDRADAFLRRDLLSKVQHAELL